MDKKGLFEARMLDDEKYRQCAERYLASLPVLPVHRVVQYHCPLMGKRWGVVVSEGERGLTIWDTFRERAVLVPHRMLAD